nr:MAG TPA: hypothetical protein [Caudoviricetes sp.]
MKVGNYMNFPFLKSFYKILISLYNIQLKSKIFA